MPSRDQKIAKPVTWNWQFLADNYGDTERCYRLSDRQVTALLAPLLQMAWRTRWHDPPADFNEIIQFVGELSNALVTPIDCDTPPTPPTPPTKHCPDLPQWVTWDGEHLTIDMDCNDMIIINQNCGCNCGCNNGSERTSFGGGTSSGGGASGSWTYTGSDDGGQAIEYGISQCDFISYVIPRILQSCAEFAQYIDDNSENLDGLVDGLASITGSIPLIGDIGGGAMQWILTVINAGSAAILSMLEDQDFEYKVMESWVKAFPNGGRITSITRQQLLSTVQYMPNTWTSGGTVIFPKIIMNGMYRILSMEKITTRLPLAENQANDNLCAFINAGAGIEYVAPPLQDNIDLPFSTEQDLLDQGYDWAHSFDLRLAPFTEGSPISWQEPSGVRAGVWELGLGYRAACDIQITTTAFQTLGFTFTSNSLGNVTYSETDVIFSRAIPGGGVTDDIRVADIYYAPEPIDTVLIDNSNRGNGGVVYDFDVDRQSNSTTACDGTAVIRRIALAGTGLDPFPNLAQEPT